MSNQIIIRPFTTTNAIMFKKQPVHKRALKKARNMFRRKPKSIQKSAKELGRSVVHAAKNAHPAAQAAMVGAALIAVGYPTVKYAQAKTQQLGLEGQTVMVQPANGQEGVIGEIVSAGRTTDPLGRECLVVLDDEGHAHSFATDECKIFDLNNNEVDKSRIRKNARSAVPFGDGRAAYTQQISNRKELRELKPVFVATSGPQIAPTKKAKQANG